MGTYSDTLGFEPVTICTEPRIELASDVKGPNDDLCAPLGCSMPLFHGLPVESRNVNHTNICTSRSALAYASACLAYVVCCAYVTPCGCAGRVWWPYSVIQIGTS